MKQKKWIATGIAIAFASTIIFSASSVTATPSMGSNCFDSMCHVAGKTPSEDTVVKPAPKPAPKPATKPAPAPAPKPATRVNAALDTSNLPEGSYYTVVKGDVFWKIAKRYNLTVNALAKLNPHIKDINWIYPGDKLVVKAAPAAPVASAPTSAPTVASKKLFHGFGEAVNYRVRGAQKDTLNVTTASAIFDQDGKIVDLTWDVMEINYALFPGWLDEAADQADKDAFVASIDNVWQTKREKGYDYDMTHKKATGAADNLTQKEWFEQLDFYESFFKGMTVAQVESWVKKYTDGAGKPYKMAYPDMLTEDAKKVTDAFSAEEKAMLVDVTTSATMSLQDGHSFFITALKEAYEARKEIK